LTEKELSERRAVLCEKYDKILGLTYHFGVADSDRDDVVQEVFVAAYLHLHQLRDIESMDSWLYKIAMRKAGRIGRKSKRREDKELLYESCEQCRFTIDVLQLNKKIARSHFCVKVKLPPQTITQEIPHDKYNTRYEISSIPFKLR